MTDQQTTPSREIRSPVAEIADGRATQPWFRKKRIALPSAVLLAFVVIMVSTGGNNPRIFDFTKSSLPPSATSATKAAAATATVGQSVRDGRFAFMVSTTARPSKTLTDRLGTKETAEGVFVVIRFDVTNIGYEARTLTATDQFLLNDKGQRFATSAAISSLAGAESVFLNKINPGRTVNDAPLLFDVPAGTKIASIEFHDSSSSTGVRVKLS